MMATNSSALGRHCAWTAVPAGSWITSAMSCAFSIKRCTHQPLPCASRMVERLTATRLGGGMGVLLAIGLLLSLLTGGECTPCAPREAASGRVVKWSGGGGHHGRYGPL